MKTVLHVLLVTCLLFSLSSCLDFREQLTLKLDGSGTAKYTFSFLSDCPISVKEKVVKDLEELANPSHNSLSSRLNLSVNCTSSECTLSIQFLDVKDLNILWQTYLSKNEVLSTIMPPAQYHFDGNSFSRYFNDYLWSESFSNSGTIKEWPQYSSLFFFEQKVIGQSNPEANLSGNKKASSLNVNFSSLKDGRSTISNSIIFHSK